jgi:hypothetical protein
MAAAAASASAASPGIARNGSGEDHHQDRQDREEIPAHVRNGITPAREMP